MLGFAIAQGIERTILGTALIYKLPKTLTSAITILGNLNYKEAFMSMKGIGGAIKTAYTTEKVTTKIKTIGKVGNALKVILSTGGTSLSTLVAGETVAGAVKTLGKVFSKGTIVGFTIGIFVDIIFSAVIDYFKYNNVLVLLPMMHKCTPYAPIISGEKLLLTGSSNVSEETISDKQEGASQEEGNPGEAVNMSDQTEED